MPKSTFIGIWIVGIGLSPGVAAALASGGGQDIDGGVPAAGAVAQPAAPGADAGDTVDVQVPWVVPRAAFGPTEAAVPMPAGAATAPGAARVLADLDPAQRRNAEIGLEPLGDPAFTELARAAGVEALWVSGRHDEAIRELEALEASGAGFAVMISWREPVAVEGAKLYYPDVRVSTRTGGSDASLDYHVGTGNIFVLVVWGFGWSIHMSSDGGASFVETASWEGSVAIADMSVCGDYVWVGYSPSSYQLARFRRLDADTGLIDTTYSYHEVADESPNTLVEFQVAGNTPDNNNRI